MRRKTRDEAGKLGRKVLTNEGNVPRPEGRDERRVEGKDWAMAAKPEGRPRPEGRPGMRLESWEGRPGMRLDSWEGRGTYQ